MKNLIYISGPITDNKTGQPRDGWQEDFRAAEEKLRGMGFGVINPIEIAKDAESGWEWEKRKFEVPPSENIRYDLSRWPENTPRWFYLCECIERMKSRLMSRLVVLDGQIGDDVDILGLYVIGDMADISMSYGTMCEINFAMAAGLPVWSQYYHGYQMTNMLMQRIDGPTLAETAKELK